MVACFLVCQNVPILKHRGIMYVVLFLAYIVLCIGGGYAFMYIEGRDEMKQCRDVDNKITAMKTALEEIENLRQGASQEVSSLRARRFTLTSDVNINHVKSLSDALIESSDLFERENETFHYTDGRIDSVLSSQLHQTYKISYNFYVNTSSLRYYPSNNHRRDDVLEIEDINPALFQSFLSTFNKSSIFGQLGAEFTKVVPVLTEPPTYKYFAELKFNYSTNIFTTNVAKTAEEHAVDLLEELQETLNLQRTDDTGIPINELTDISYFLSPFDVDSDYGDFGPMVKKMAELYNEDIALLYNNVDNRPGEMYPMTKYFILCKVVNNSFHSLKRTREIFNVEDRKLEVVLDNSYYAESESGYDVNGGLFSEIWNQQEEFRTEKEKYITIEHALDMEEKGITSQINTFKEMLGVSSGSDGNENGTKDEESPLGASVLPVQPPPAHPSTKKILPKIGGSRNRRDASGNLTEFNCTIENVNECLEHINCPGLFTRTTNAIFFAAQVVTTVGYGSQYPKSNNAKIFICAYALLSVPIVAFGMGQYALLFKSIMVGLRHQICGPEPSRCARLVSILIYMVICLTLFAGIFILLFYDVEGWDMVTSIYFTIVTMTTIGFGDYEPTFQLPEQVADGDDRVDPIFPKSMVLEPGFLVFYRYILIAWMFFGVAWLGGIFGLVVEELESIAQQFTKTEEDKPAIEFDALPDYDEDPDAREAFYAQHGITSQEELDSADDNESVFADEKDDAFDHYLSTNAKQITVHPIY